MEEKVTHDPDCQVCPAAASNAASNAAASPKAAHLCSSSVVHIQH